MSCIRKEGVEQNCFLLSILYSRVSPKNSNKLEDVTKAKADIYMAWVLSWENWSHLIKGWKVT